MKRLAILVASTMIAVIPSLGVLANSPETINAMQPVATSPATPAKTAEFVKSKGAVEHPVMKRAVMMHTRKRVEEIQAALNQHGMSVQTDGIWGPKTKIALEKFQREAGLRITGQPNHKTIQKLNPPNWKEG